MLRLGGHSFTILLRKGSVRRSSEGPWLAERRCEHAGYIMAGWLFRSEIMPEDMIRIGAYCSEEANISLASEFLE